MLKLNKNKWKAVPILNIKINAIPMVFKISSLSDIWLIGLIIFIVFQIILAIKSIDYKKNILYSSVFIYTFLVLSLTFCPLSFINPNTFTDVDYNFIPFQYIIPTISNRDWYSVFKFVIGNVIMFIPCGFLLSVTKKNNNFVKILLWSMFFSTCIELAQGFIGFIVGYHYRSMDIDDIILNTFGGIVGWVIYQMMPEKITKIYVNHR